MVNILFLTSSYPAVQDLMNRTFMSELAESLSSGVIRIFILCPHRKGLPYREMQGKITIIRFPYWFTAEKQRLGETGGMKASTAGSPLAMFQVIPFCICQFFVSLKIIREEKIDLIHSHWIIPQGLCGAFLRFLFGTPHITSVHGTDVHLVHSHHITLPVIRFIATYTDCITTNSSHTYRLIHTIAPASGKKTCIIPMGIYPDMFSGPKFRQPSEEKTILFVGRLISWKGVNHLIEAVKKVFDHQFRFHLIIIGDGPEREELEELSRKLKMHCFVEFTGRVNKKTLLAYYQQADLFVLPSITVDGQTEGLGVVLLEAMAANVPVIGSNTGGIPDIIQDGVNGLLVPPGDPDALADAILSILSNPDLADRFRTTGLQTVQKRFSWDSIAEQFIRVYQTTLFNQGINSCHKTRKKRDPGK